VFTIKIYKLDVFTKHNKGGNPAAIVMKADKLTPLQMQAIATRLNYPATAFIKNSLDHDFFINFFSPTSEIDLCGHATIGAFYLLFKLGVISAGGFKMETIKGEYKIKVSENGTIMMEQGKPSFFEKVSKIELAHSLNITLNDFINHLEPQIVSTGMRDIMVPIKSIETLNRINPNYDAIKRISEKYKVSGYHLFSFETMGGTAHCRNFAPLYGIPEEAACGTANGALSAYIAQLKTNESNNTLNFVMEQGYAMSKPSEILTNVTIKDNQITVIAVGGTASNIEKMEVII
jgi:PhzF family phenazine biosynthesis protein